MELTFDKREGAEALHPQLMTHLRERIRNGSLPAGARLPSELLLAEEYHISRGTVRQEQRRRGGAYWYAYHRAGKKMLKRYLGKTSEVTLARREQVAEELAAARAFALGNQQTPTRSQAPASLGAGFWSGRAGRRDGCTGSIRSGSASLGSGRNHPKLHRCIYATI